MIEESCGAATDVSTDDEWTLRTAVGRLEEVVFSSGAAEGRPPEERQLTRASKSTIFCPEGTCFVNRSAALTSPLIFRSSMEEPFTLCWVQRARVSICRSLPNPARPKMPMVAVESVHTLRATPSQSLPERVCIRGRCQRPWRLHRTQPRHY